MKTVVILRNVMIGGEPKELGDKVSLEDNVARYLVNIGKAAWPKAKKPAAKAKKETADSKEAENSEKR